MDIFAHTLWTNALAQEANAFSEKKKNNINPPSKKFHISIFWATFWGIFPDIFAFSFSFFQRLYVFLLSDIPWSQFFIRPGSIEGQRLEGGLDLAHNLYQYSHSLVIFAAVFIIVWIFYKRPRYELLGWALHILIDIPSHVLAFFPTPFLFPISDFKFKHGIQWSNFWFMVINYTALLCMWVRLLARRFSKKV